jgi:hypothetical protein
LLLLHMYHKPISLKTLNILRQGRFSNENNISVMDFDYPGLEFLLVRLANCVRSRNLVTRFGHCRECGISTPMILKSVPVLVIPEL